MTRTLSFVGWLWLLVAAEPSCAQNSSLPAKLPAGIEVSFSAPAEVRRGDSLAMAMKVKNTGKDVVVVHLYAQGDWSLDPIVRADDGSVLWERGVDSGFLMSGGLAIMLPPGGEHQFRAVWQRVAVPDGSSGVLHVTPRLLGPTGSPVWTGRVVDVRIRP